MAHIEKEAVDSIFSGKEVVNDISGAIEVDHNAVAPERNNAEEGLQVFQATPFNALRPSSQEDRSPSGSVPKPPSPSGWSLKTKIFLSTSIILIAIIAIALGVGLEFGSPRERAEEQPSPSSPPTSANSSTPSLTPNLKNGILDDTSLVAITSHDNNRHIFFQDLNGSIRHTVYDQFSSRWLENSDYVATTQTPRNLTPLAAVSTIQTQTSPNAILLLFVDVNNLLASATYLPGRVNLGNINFSQNLSFPVAPGSRTLSVTQMKPIPSTIGLSFADAALFYEAPNGNITALRGSLIGGNDTFGWQWTNVTGAINSLMIGNYICPVWLFPPLGSCSSQEGSTSSIFLDFFNPCASHDAKQPAVLNLEIKNWTSISPTSAQPVTPRALANATSAIPSSDLASYIVSGATVGGSIYNDVAFVQNQRLNVGATILPPNTLYPFSRFALLNGTSNSVTYVYHQLDNGVLVEDAFHAEAEWISTNITIGTVPR